MHVRDATPDDAMPVFALHVAASRRLSGDHYTEEQVLDWADKRGDGPERYETDDLLVAERGGNVVGFGEWADGGGGEDARENSGGRVGEILACYVHPDHARSGVGAALLARIHDELREAGYDRAALTSSLNAVTFYERHGYEQVERFTIQPGDVEFPIVRMARNL